MVAISLYKGNLHKVPNVPRRWPRPESKLSLKEFKILLRRREKSLARIRCPNEELAATSNSSLKPTSVGNANVVNSDAFLEDNVDINGNFGIHVDDLGSQPELHQNGVSKDEEVVGEKGDSKDVEMVTGEDTFEKSGWKTDSLADEKNEANAQQNDEEEIHVNPSITITEEAILDMEKRKEKIKEKLEILNEKKHSLVQVLKQILNAEEQLKRQNCSTQAMPGRPPLSLQVDTSTESDSVMKANNSIPRMGSDGNTYSPETDGSGVEDASNRHLPRTSSISPSSVPLHEKPFSNMAPPQSYRTATVGVAGSPSTVFTPPVQGSSLVSVSEAGHVPSSTSPAAAQDHVRHPSPWNN